jgi:N-acetylmuramoyl-L-alanine amidase
MAAVDSSSRTTSTGTTRTQSPSSTATTTSTPQGQSHVVKSGETLSGIARSHDVSLGSLVKANPQVTDPDLIRPGQRLNIPAKTAGTTSSAPARTPAPKTTAPTTAPVPDAPVPAPTSSGLTAPTSTLRRGAHGADVEKLQKALVNQGYMSQATMNTGPGVFGPATESSLKKFQKDHGLSADGVYGPKSRAALQQALGQPGNTQAPPGETTTGTTNGTTGSSGTHVKPPVKSLPSPNHSSRNGTDIDTIVLHHTASNNGKGDISWLRNPDSKVSSHYVVDKDGTISQLVSDDRKAWHAGKAGMPGKGISDVNARSIGIEIVNDGKGTPFTEAQYKALEKLVPYLADKYKVPESSILGHKDVARPKGRKDDPASNFDWSRVRDAVK